MNGEHDVGLGRIRQDDGAQAIGGAQAAANVVTHARKLFLGEVCAVAMLDELRHGVGE